MASKYKTTGCARFFFFLIIFIPIVYFGLKYFDDQGQLDDWRSKLNLDKNKNAVEEVMERKGSNDDSEFDMQQVKRQIADLLHKIEEQNQIIEDQANTIKDQKETIDQLSGEQGESTPSTKEATIPKKDGDNASLEELLKEADKALRKN